MVFYYTIRGGKCLNGSSNITLSSEDIICYVGRDKHENEYLIQYGWPGDIWFHVEGLSSAHVYFRLKNTDTVSSIPLDDLPVDSVYDMMQICKHNSIAGSKLASCKMVYTPHSNLKKTFDMASGSVTYHNTKLTRHGRCEKDRKRIRELEKTKTADMTVDYYQEMKDNERRIIERKKRMRNQQKKDDDNDIMYDPILDDLQSTKINSTRQGDKDSGLDVGLSVLEGLSLSTVTTSSSHNHHPSKARTNTTDTPTPEQPPEEQQPIWIQEDNDRALEPSQDVRFLRERGYPADDSIAAMMHHNNSRIQALQQLYNKYNNHSHSSSAVQQDIPDDVIQARLDEKEVLLAMFGDEYDDDDDDYGGADGDDNNDDKAVFSSVENANSLDVALPITTYEPPDRYGVTPPLIMEVYVDNNIAPLYPESQPPVLAVLGGGLAEAQLRELTIRLCTEAKSRIEEEPGEPQIFNLLSFLTEETERIVQKETEELEAQQRLLEKQKAAARSLALKREAQRRKKEAEEQGYATSSTKFSNELERRDYAKSILAKGAYANNDKTSDKNPPKGRKYYDTGVNDQSLINDLFS